LQEVAEQHAIVERSLRLIGDNPLPAPERPRVQWSDSGGEGRGRTDRGM